MFKSIDYLIAYTDSKGRDFQGLPWVEAPFKSFDDANRMCQQFIQDGLVKEAFVFAVKKGSCPQEITWEFAREHRVLGEE